MSRIKTAGGILSHSQKNIIYFVSDDREIIEQMINGNKYVFAQRLSGKIDEDRGYFVIHMQSSQNATLKIVTIS